MALDPKTAPDRDIVKAYTLCFGNEAGKAVLQDLRLFIEKNMASSKDKLGRIDTASCVAQLAAERVLKRIEALSNMDRNPEWHRIDAARQVAEAASKI